MLCSNPRRYSRDRAAVCCTSSLRPIRYIRATSWPSVHTGAFVNIFTLASTLSPVIYPDRLSVAPGRAPGSWHLRQICATHPDFRGQGAGAAVLHTAVRLCGCHRRAGLEAVSAAFLGTGPATGRWPTSSTADHLHGRRARPIWLAPGTHGLDVRLPHR